MCRYQTCIYSNTSAPPPPAAEKSAHHRSNEDDAIDNAGCVVSLQSGADVVAPSAACTGGTRCRHRRCRRQSWPQPRRRLSTVASEVTTSARHRRHRRQCRYEIIPGHRGRQERRRVNPNLVCVAAKPRQRSRGKRYCRRRRRRRDRSRD